MARFKHLELPDDPLPKSQTRQAEPVSEKPEKRYKSGVADWMQEADAQRRKGQYESALRSFGRALECERSYVPAWVGQAQMLILLNESRQAEMWTISGLKIFPNNADILAARAQAVCRLGNFKEALMFSDASIQGEGTCAYRWSVRGELMTATKSPTANHCFDSAEQIEADWLIRTEHANILRYYKSPLKAMARAAAAVEKAPDSPFAWMIKGVCEYEAGFRSQAISSLETTLQLDPESKDVQYWIGIVKQDTGLMRWLRSFFQRR
jgi:tetratricopeptide (TPR) repeat protein